MSEKEPVIIRAATWPQKDMLGNEVVLTDELVEKLATRFTFRRAMAYAMRMRPQAPTYHLKVESIGWGRYEINAYQNRLRPNEPDHPRADG